MRPKGLGAAGRIPSYTTDESSEGYEEADSDLIASSNAPSGMSESRARRYLQAQRSRIRRTVLRAVRTAINGRDADGLKAVTSFDGNRITTFADGALAGAGDIRPSGIDRTLLSLDFSSLIKYLPPDFWGQDYEIREFPVKQVAQGGRRRRIVGQIRRRMEVARRDFVVFD